MRNCFRLSIALIAVAVAVLPTRCAEADPTIEEQIAALTKRVAALEAAILQRQATRSSATEWERLYDLAVAEQRPLCVWVGYSCPSSAGQVPGFLHLHVESPWRDVRGPAVVVLLPDGRGTLTREGVVPSDRVCAAELRAMVERVAREREAASAPMATVQPVVVQSLRAWSASRDGACAT